jgi:8-oxo-dGTP pyrophosphatase MutT (NUDIX family)
MSKRFGSFIYHTSLGIWSVLFSLHDNSSSKGVKSDMLFSMETLIAKKLASRECKRITDAEMVPCAVLVLLFEMDGEYHLLFTRRSDKVEHHKGEISFPGGRVDPDDSDLLHTALREGAEEIGLHPHDVTILGRLDDISTVTTGFVVTPYVAMIPYPYQFQINTDEICELIFVPLQTLAEKYRVEASDWTWKGEKVTPYKFCYQDYIIWGATARILKQLLDIILMHFPMPHRQAP